MISEMVTASNPRSLKSLPAASRIVRRFSVTCSRLTRIDSLRVWPLTIYMIAVMYTIHDDRHEYTFTQETPPMTGTQTVRTRADVPTLETAPTRYVEGSGVRFAYRRLGPSTGTPLVLLQHFSGTFDAWDPAVVNALAADRPVIAFDNAGVGRSTGQTPDSVEAMARDAITFINLLGFSKVDLLGFSLGGCVAQQMAAEHGRLVRK